MSDRKAKFCWASIAGADPEPVEMVRIDGRPAIYTCGCADPFYLDDKSVPVRLGRAENRSQNSDASPVFLEEASWVAIARPLLADKWQADQDAKIAERAARKKAPSRSGVRSFVTSHGWRGPR
jgi:hypothetical protein